VKKLLFVIIITAPLFAQVTDTKTDSSKKFSVIDTIKQITIKKEHDSIPGKSILELKSIIGSDHFKIDMMRKLLEEKNDLEIFTKDEIASGMSRNELLAYKKNKQILLGILHNKIEECWWFRVKSIGELTGIPDLLIQAFMMSLLLL